MHNTTILDALVHETIERSDGRNFQVELVPPHVVCPWPSRFKEPGETKYGYRAPTMQETADNPCCLCVPVWKRQFRVTGVMEYLHGLAAAKVNDLLPMSLPHMSRELPRGKIKLPWATPWQNSKSNSFGVFRNSFQ